MYDLVIVGAGPGGLTSAIYAGRKKMKCVLVTGFNVGGETNKTNNIENYPGYEGPGAELMQKFFDSAKKWGCEIVEHMVVKITKPKDFIIELDDGKKLDSKTVILCYGRERRKLGVVGEDKFLGRGLSTCTTCDAPLFSNKDAAIIGGGNSAVEGALELASIANKVYLVHRRDQFRADEVTVELAKKNPKIELVLSCVPVEIKGDKFVSALVVENVNSKEKRELPVQGVFSEIGWETKTELVSGLVDTNPAGEIVVDQFCRTKTPGLYACGDLTNMLYKQTVIAAGMGAVATLDAYRFLTGSVTEYSK
ncbi:FAD-dependent oxidoreductase [Candidatus Woesearchaeota archaeon]|nr:FAD-dependent oxidoreductase [Candidatus Woesearchaeota archaeon]